MHAFRWQNIWASMLYAGRRIKWTKQFIKCRSVCLPHSIHSNTDGHYPNSVTFSRMPEICLRRSFLYEDEEPNKFTDTTHRVLHSSSLRWCVDWEIEKKTTFTPSYISHKNWIARICVQILLKEKGTFSQEIESYEKSNSEKQWNCLVCER